jgi:hypothetical protein
MVPYFKRCRNGWNVANSAKYIGMRCNEPCVGMGLLHRGSLCGIETEASLPCRQQVALNGSTLQSMCSVQHKNDRFRSIHTQFHTYIIPRAAALCTKMQPFRFPLLAPSLSRVQGRQPLAGCGVSPLHFFFPPPQAAFQEICTQDQSQEMKKHL